MGNQSWNREVSLLSKVVVDFLFFSWTLESLDQNKSFTKRQVSSSVSTYLVLSKRVVFFMFFFDWGKTEICRTMTKKKGMRTRREKIDSALLLWVRLNDFNWLVSNRVAVDLRTLALGTADLKKKRWFRKGSKE